MSRVTILPFFLLISFSLSLSSPTPPSPPKSEKFQTMEWCEGPPHSSFNLSLSSLFVEVNERGEVEFVVEGSGGRGVFVVGSEYDFELWEEATGRRDKVRKSSFCENFMEDHGCFEETVYLNDNKNNKNNNDLVTFGGGLKGQLPGVTSRYEVSFRVRGYVHPSLYPSFFEDEENDDFVGIDMSDYEDDEDDGGYYSEPEQNDNNNNQETKGHDNEGRWEDIFCVIVPFEVQGKDLPPPSDPSSPPTDPPLDSSEASPDCETPQMLL